MFYYILILYFKITNRMNLLQVECHFNFPWRISLIYEFQQKILLWIPRIIHIISVQLRFFSRYDSSALSTTSRQTFYPKGFIGP